MAYFIVRRFAKVSTVCTLLALMAFGQASPLAKAIGPLVEAKQQAENAVLTIKSEWAPGSVRVKRAREAYNLAQQQYSAWTATMSIAIREDSLEKLEKDITFHSKCDDARKAAAAFDQIFRAGNGPAKKNPALLALLVPAIAPLVGEAIRAMIPKSMSNAEGGAFRSENAKYFETKVTWSKWDDIKP